VLLLAAVAAAVLYTLIIVLLWLVFVGVSYYRQKNLLQRKAVLQNLRPLVLMSISSTMSYFYMPVTSSSLSLLACRSVNVPISDAEGKLEFMMQNRWVLVSRVKSRIGRQSRRHLCA
jgi:hypothetical protein